ncbi:MAG: TIGR03936 family radical SAM-associated protein [Clostridiales bacterium]|nr:TIGR03936 family radical SAM-associated protein [Clostridiales bacterium]
MAKMHAHRLLYEKTGRAIYISHLDTMAQFQRAFFRAGLEIWQTEGYNRHAYVSIALPLSLGFSSRCEILEFDLVSKVPLGEVPALLNRALPEGLRVLSCYEAERPFKQIRTLDWFISLDYDSGIPEDVETAFRSFLSPEHLIVRKPSKKSKKGYTELDLIPMVHRWSMEPAGERQLILRCNLAAQEPSLNPQLLMEAFTARYPALTPDFARYCREEVFQENGEIFR